MRRLSLLFALALLAPAAFAQKPSDKPDAEAVGTWNYTVVTPQQTYEGSFTIVPTDDGYEGEFVTDASRRMTALDVDGTRARFEFEQPGMGQVTVDGAVDAEGMFKGETTVGPDTYSFSATRGGALQMADLVGTWSYKVMPPGSDAAEGTFVLREGDDGLAGTFTTDGPREVRAVTVVGNRLSFEFDQPGMGVIAISGTISDGAFVGTAWPENTPGPAEMTAFLLSDAAMTGEEMEMADEEMADEEVGAMEPADTDD